MKHLTFDEVIHYGSGRYAIDWDNGERKYKEPCQGIKVYEHGLYRSMQQWSTQPFLEAARIQHLQVGL